MLDDLIKRFHQKDRRALSRLVSYLARGEEVEKILHSLGSNPHKARVVALTGSGGVGKSTLTGCLIESIRGQQKTVAVLACDPQSPLSGGALLGDRFRMPSRPGDSGVFIRSLAAVGGHGALADHIGPLLRLLGAFGFNVVLVETVGAGQGDTLVRNLADVLVLLLQPETGDDLQWEKAGLTEVADLIVINKADLPGADRLEGQVKAMLSLSPGPEIPIIPVSGRTGLGVERLWSAIGEVPPRINAGFSTQELLRNILDLVELRFQNLINRRDLELMNHLVRWQQGEVSSLEATLETLRIIQQKNLIP